MISLRFQTIPDLKRMIQRREKELSLAPKEIERIQLACERHREEIPQIEAELARREQAAKAVQP